MEAPPSYNEATGTAPPMEHNDLIPPKMGGGAYQRGQPHPTGFVVPPPAATQSPRFEGVTVTRQTVYLPQVALGPKSQRFTCPTCHEEIMTDVETEANTKTHMFALILCIIGCWPCCLIPYCTDSCMSTRHSCPQCGAFIGNFSE